MSPLPCWLVVNANSAFNVLFVFGRIDHLTKVFDFVEASRREAGGPNPG